MGIVRLPGVTLARQGATSSLCRQVRVELEVWRRQRACWREAKAAKPGFTWACNTQETEEIV